MAQNEDFSLDKGSDVVIELHLQDAATNAAKNLTGYSVAAKLKKTFNSDSDSTTDFGTTITNATTGVVALSLTNTQTGVLNAGRYVYDVELSFLDSSSNTIIERILEGTMNITPSVTR
jgi:hypothetical protein